MKLTGAGKVIFFILLFGAIMFGVYKWRSRPQEVKSTQLVGAISIPPTATDIVDAPLTTAVKLPFPEATPVSDDGTRLRITINEMAWQAQNGINYANGGKVTAQNSLFDRAGLYVTLNRQDNCTQSCTDLVKNIKDYSTGATKEGVIIIFMGSGVPAYMNAITTALQDVIKTNPSCAPVIFGESGLSHGEDQVIGPAEIRDNMQLLRGKVVRGVMLDGDLDLSIKLAGDNGIPVNPNSQVYDPTALNLSYADTYVSAVNDYNLNKTETRKLIKNGKTTGKDTTVGYDMVATWTPGDVTAHEGRGGVTIISTKEYGSIMPAVLIGCKKFLKDNSDKIENMLAAIAMAGDQLNSFDDARHYVSRLNKDIWAEQTPEYWYKYFKGVTKKEDPSLDDKSHLGGSVVFGLSGMAREMGMGTSGGPDFSREIYTTFGTKQSSLYPKELPSFPDYQKAVDKSFLLSVIANHSELLKGKPLAVSYADKMTTKVASKDVQINFETGSARIADDSKKILDDIYSEAVTADGLKVGIYGHTDNTGSPNKNLTLSEQRAAAVKQYLLDKGLSDERIESQGFGETRPIASNATSTGKAKNRRVQIVLGK